MQQMMSLFAAHSPTPETMKDRFQLCFCAHMSLCTMIKRPDNAIPPFAHTHDEYEFIIPYTPIPFLLNDGAVYFGDVDFVFPVQSGRPHGVRYKISDISHDNIVVRKEYLEHLLVQRGRTGCEFNYEFRLSDDLKFYLQAFKAEFARGEPLNNHKMDLLCELICLELIDAGADPSLDTRKAKYGYQKGVQAVAVFINDNYNRDISMDELAAMCGFSRNYFLRVFKNALGESPYSYLSKMRISRAKLLLETTADSIQEIAEKCGFKKANSFTSQFKTVTGVTPRAYRADSRR